MAPRRRAGPVRDHDFASEADGKAIPYGIYDLAAHAGWVNVGTDHDTAAFAVEIDPPLVERHRPGRLPAAGVRVAAHTGGSTATAPVPGRQGSAALALDTGLAITVCHFPPGTSKWNKIEHRLFSRITMNWRGRPLASHQVIVESIAATTTATGLRVHAALDPAATRPRSGQQDLIVRPAADPPRLARRVELHATVRAPGPAAARAAARPRRAAWAHPALTGLDPPPGSRLITTLHARLGDPPAGRRPQPLNLADQALITLLSLRFRPHAAALAQLFAVPVPAITTAHSRIWPLLVQAGYPTELAGPQLKTLTDLTAYAHANGL